MSHIPNSAMPHAAPSQNSETSQQQSEQGGGGLNIGAQAGKIADYARENPKTAIAAGAAVVGAIAAAAIPLVRGRAGSGEQSDGNSSGKGGGKGGGKSGSNS